MTAMDSPRALKTSTTQPCSPLSGWGTKSSSVATSLLRRLCSGRSRLRVARAEEWPGVHCVNPLLTGAPVEGTWFDRTLEYTTRLRRKELAPGESAKPGLAAGLATSDPLRRSDRPSRDHCLLNLTQESAPSGRCSKRLALLRGCE